MEKKYRFAIILNAIVVCVGLACQIAALTRAPHIEMPIIEIVMYALICFYAFAGYKKPHGNLLRYLMIVFIITMLANIYVDSKMLNGVTIVINAAAIALVAYMAGRLNKIKQNRFIAVMVLLLLCHCSHAMIVAQEALGTNIDFIDRIIFYTPAFMWIALSSAYFTRFAQHKEAGLTDK